MNKAGIKTIKRRRKENKTDYHKRIGLLKSSKSRLVFRKTNQQIIAQYVSSKEAQDKIEFGVVSKDLLKYGWPENAKGSLKSISASYLTGYLIGEKIIKEKKETPIIDLGMYRKLHKTKLFAFIKGVIDSGLKIPTKKEIFPSEERIEGKHLKNKIDFKLIKSKIEKE